MAKKAKRVNRRARGTGSIFRVRAGKNAGRWVGRKVIGKKADGKPLKVERWGSTQGEVIKKLEAAVAPGPDTTVGQWAERWLAGLQVRPQTRAGYEKNTRLHVVPAWGGLRLRDVTPSRVEALAVKLAPAMSPNTVRLVLAHARVMLNAAVRDGIIDRNPVTIAKKPKARRKVVDPFTPAELVRIIEAATDYPPGRMAAVQAGIGARAGEVLALDVGDFDPKARTLSITKTYHRKHGIGPPKSAHSVRTVRVPDAAVPAVELAAAGRTSGPLFPTEAGNRRGMERARDGWVEVLKRAGLAFRNAHQARHSVATNLIAAGVPLGDVAQYLGDTVETIVRTYLHPTGTDPADALDRLYGGRKVGKGEKKGAK